MIKILGCMLIFTASVGCAYSIQTDMRRHLKRLYELRRLLTEIFWEMTYSVKPVEVILQYQMRREDYYIAEILSEICEGLKQKEATCGAEIWREIFAQHRKKLGLKAEEGELIEQAGRAFFGKSVEENQKVLALYQERLDFLIEVEQKERKEKQKVYQTVCIMCGLVLIIILI